METIDKTAIHAKIGEGQASFAKIKEEIAQIEAQEAQLKTRKTELNVELFRIQGEHRVLKSLLGKEVAEETPPEEVN